MKCVHVQHTNRIDLTDWSFNTGHDVIDRIIGAIATPIIREEFEKDAPAISLPFYWGEQDGYGGKPVENPLTLDIQLPLGNDEESVVYRTTLEEVINDEFFNEFEPAADYSAKIARVVDELERLAKHYRERMGKKSPDEATPGQ
jgi:hypothetical protein